MIEKLDLEKRHSFGTLDWLENWNEPSGAKLIETKINELVDAVNKLETMAKNTNTVLKSLVVENNIHEKQIDEFQEAFESTCFNYKDRLNWIGRRCNFSNDCENWIEDIFMNIDRNDKEPEIPKYRASNGKLYKYCKLVTEPKTPTENVPEPIKLYVCGDGSVHDNLDVAKSHAASIFNPLPAGATTTDRVYLEQELIRTRKALDFAVDALKQIREINIFLPQIQMIDKALEQITALEQKDAK